MQRPGTQNLLMVPHPNQNENPSPAIAPAIAAMRSIHALALDSVANALMPIMSVEPGTTVPMTGTASDNANMKIATYAYCECPETKAMTGEKYDMMQ
jgi:hypothetical protein